jgi:hypothetical protein
MGDFNTPLSPTDRSSKEKINKEIIELNDTKFKWTSVMSTEYYIKQQHNIILLNSQ